LQIRKITPILAVDAIEPLLPFWVDRLGYAAVATVPHGDSLGFAILVNGDTSVMLQTRDSLRADLSPEVYDRFDGAPSVLYVDVGSLEEAERVLEGAEILVPRRRTFYGADEIWIREPSGSIVGFAHHEQKS
jgi:hypothetical protein